MWHVHGPVQQDQYIYAWSGTGVVSCSEPHSHHHMHMQHTSHPHPTASNHQRQVERKAAACMGGATKQRGRGKQLSVCVQARCTQSKAGGKPVLPLDLTHFNLFFSLHARHAQNPGYLSAIHILWCLRCLGYSCSQLCKGQTR